MRYFTDRERAALEEIRAAAERVAQVQDALDVAMIAARTRPPGWYHCNITVEDVAQAAGLSRATVFRRIARYLERKSQADTPASTPSSHADTPASTPSSHAETSSSSTSSQSETVPRDRNVSQVETSPRGALS